MARNNSLDMTSAEFTRIGNQLLEWLANYLDHSERFPVATKVEPGSIRKKLPLTPPLHSEPMENILLDFENIIVPGLTHWNHPSFMGYFSISSSKPAILGELLSAGLNVNGMLWKTSPAATELEEVVLGWLRQALGLPPAFHGTIHDTASTSSLVAMAAARESLRLGIREKGIAGRDLRPLTVYTSEHAHSSIERAAMILGIGQENVRKIPVDDSFKMNPDELREALVNDKKAGNMPCCVVATVGTTSTTSIDPVNAIAEICEDFGVWLHVDAAYGGIAGMVPSMRWVLDGCEKADSIVVNPHKWLFVPIDCSVLYCRRPEVLRKTFMLVPEYLRTDDRDVTNFMDYGIALGRRFRALKLWLVFRYFGMEGIVERLQHHISLAQKLRSWIGSHPSFEIMAPSPFSVVCFRCVPQEWRSRSEVMTEPINQLNLRLLEAINESGELFLSHTKLNGRISLRLAVGNLQTTEQHVTAAWGVIQRIYGRMQDAVRELSIPG
ncbi:MAG TPA: pyridoxal-dependent decarboxylase [Bacteroidota bacterium]|nr:pyridoxal-dependent decarboxylase [Bacteroidota bacterium]